MHMPREIKQPFPLLKDISVQEKYTDDRLWMPEHGQRPYPLVVRVTGGEDVSQEAEALNHAGYAVFSCYADQTAMERDLDACAVWQAALDQKLDALLQEHPVLDTQRVFVDGWLTAYLVFHTNRFVAAVQRPALLHRATAFGNCAAGETAFSGQPLVEQMKQLTAQSVLADVDNCKTPCLVLYQEGNPRYSREQSEQLYAAMKDRNGDIPCRMVVLPNNTFCDWQQVCMEELAAWWKRFSDGKEAAQ